MLKDNRKKLIFCTKYFTFLLLGLLLITSSCGKESAKEEPFSIIGAWNLEKIEVEYTENGITQIFKDENPIGTYTFLDDETGQANITFSINGEKEEIISTFDYSATSTFVIIVYEDGSRDSWSFEDVSSNSFTAAETVAIFDAEQENYFFFSRL